MSLDENVQSINQLVGQTNSNHWHISIKPGTDAFRNGFKPEIMFDHITELGTIISAKLITDIFPSLNNYDPKGCYLGWDLILNSSKTKKTISNAFIHLDDFNIHILPPKSLIPCYKKMLEKLPDSDDGLGVILSAMGSLTETELQQALLHQKQSGGLVGDILVEQGSVQPEVVNYAIEKQEKIRDVKKRELDYVRVESDKLNKLVDLVGDLVIRAGQMSQIAVSRDDNKLIDSAEEMSLTLKSMRDATSSLNMVPISKVFYQVKNDVLQEFNKDINFEIIGEQTELDRTTIEKIFNPLKQVIRNAIEHGIDSSTEDLKQVNDIDGVITLKAYHETGSIVIKVSDNGVGLNPERLLDLAKKRGLVGAEESLYEDEIYSLIFDPSISTTSSLNSVSCRGIGLNAVRRNIESLRGNVAVDSVIGQGVTITIRLPLGLSVINGIHVSAANESFILPSDMMVTYMKLNSKQVSELDQQDFVNIKGELLPVIRMDSYLNSKSVNKPSLNSVLLIVECDKQQIALLVDEFHGEIQTVIKPLGNSYSDSSDFSGFSILASGQFALILDAKSLIKSIIGYKNDKKEHRLYA